MENYTALLEWLTRAVLIVLFILSIYSVAVIFERLWALRRADDKIVFEQAVSDIQNRHWSALKDRLNPQQGVRSGALLAALATDSKDPSQIENAVKSYLITSRGQLERGFTTLATLGSNAPFIGLFGTVLGIIQAFAVLSTDQTNTSFVMKAISEALIATAVGLFVAIPAVIAYNALSRRVKSLLSDCEALKELYLSRLETGKR